MVGGQAGKRNRSMNKVRLSTMVAPLLLVAGCSSSIDGTYRIMGAYALAHDQAAIHEIATARYNDEVRISEGTISISGQQYALNPRDTLYLTSLEFERYHAGMNYSGIGSDVFGKLDEGDRIALWRLSNHDPRSILGSNLFHANGFLLVDAQIEYEDRKEWSNDMYFYLARRE